MNTINNNLVTVRTLTSFEVETSAVAILRTAQQAVSSLGGIVAAYGLGVTQTGKTVARLRAELGQAQEMSLNNPGQARVLGTEVATEASRLLSSWELRRVVDEARASRCLAKKAAKRGKK